MTGLMPLTLSRSSSAVQLSPPSTATASAMSISSDGDSTCSAASNMDNAFQEPTASSNFPEMLVQDLEASTAAFMSRSMTAGCPFAGLRQPSDQDEPYRLPGRGIIGPPTPRFRRRSTSQPRRHSLINASLDVYDQSSDAEQELRQQQDETNEHLNFADSESEASLGMEPPPSFRTRGQSVATAATSVSGRRSSLLSHKTRSPSSPTSSPDSPSMTRNSHEGTWFDADADADAEAEPDSGSSYIAAEVQVSCKNRLAFPSRSAGNDGSNHRVGESSSDVQGSLRLVTRCSNLSGYGRAYSPSNQLTTEKPRIVNILPVAIPRRRSSLKKDHGRTTSNISATRSRKIASTDIPAQYYEPSPGREGSLWLASSQSMQLLATHNGRTVIDASHSSSGDLRLAAGRHQTVSPPPDDFDELQLDIREEGVHEETHSREVTSNQRRSVTHIESWNDPAVERLARPRQQTMYPHIKPGISGLPLPTDVIETLRVSITCFPETMLLSSSLSIETIRTYSKKLKHRVTDAPPHHSFPDEARSFFRASASEYPRKPVKRLSLPWFSHGHGSKKQQQIPPLTPQPPAARAAPLDGPVEFNWAPIKAIFPYGSDYLCDALYAHIIAYNYINTLCPPPPSRSRMLPCHPSGSSMNDSAAPGRIPEKAASVLGMNALANPTAPPAALRPTTPGPYLQHRQSISRRLFRKDHGDDDSASLRSHRSLGSGRLSGIGHRHENSSHDFEVPPGLRDIHSGLEKCIIQLVAALQKKDGRGCNDIEGTGGETSTLLIRDQQRQNESGDAGADALLLRALCEVVKLGEV